MFSFWWNAGHLDTTPLLVGWRPSLLDLSGAAESVTDHRTARSPGAKFLGVPGPSPCQQQLRSSGPKASWIFRRSRCFSGVSNGTASSST